MILDDKYYNISDNGLLHKINIEQAVADNPDEKLFELIMPSGIQELDSFCISTTYHELILNIVIPEGVSVIPSHFLNGGFELKSITLPTTIKRIEDSAFYNCNKLEKVNFPEGLEFIGHSAFSLCKSLTKIDLPDSIDEIDICAFRECTGLKSVQLPKIIKTIGCDAFAKTLTLDMLQKRAGCYYLGSSDNPYYMLYKVDENLENYEIHEETRIINAGTFSWNDKMKKILLPRKLVSIGRDAFWHCKNLARIKIPNTVVSIGERAFGNSGVKSASFGLKIKYLPTDIFDCPLHKINYLGTMPDFLSIVKQYGWVDPYQIIEVQCRDGIIIKDKRNTTRYKYKKMFDD